MTNTSESFFADLRPIANAAEMAALPCYRDLPADWWVVMTDVKGSTRAIEQGRYKEVNMVGVSTIVAVQNALGDLAFPFIFGGDGATLAIPPQYKARVEGALALARATAESQFGLGLRVALIPANRLQAEGGALRVAKLALSPIQHLALFSGAGWSVAEAWLKSRESEFALAADAAPLGDFTGMECRWNPIAARKHEMMALIVQARGPSAEAIYRRVLAEILDPSLKPLTIAGLPLTWPPVHLRLEARLRVRGIFRRLNYLFGAYVKTGLAAFILKLRGRQRNLQQPIAYLRELTENTDYIKFDDCLRMVIDVSAEQKQRLLALLEAHRQAGEIQFGYHCDKHALMTCFVRGPQKHIHFVDAAGGGYAMAAKKLKAAKAQATNP